MSAANNEYTPGRNRVTLGSSVTDAFYEAVRRWQAQRDSDPNRLDTHELVEQVFASHGLRIGDLAEAATGSEGLRDFVETVAATSNDPHLSQEAQRILNRMDDPEQARAAYAAPQSAPAGTDSPSGPALACPHCDSPDGKKWHRLSCVEVRSSPTLDWTGATRGVRCPERNGAWWCSRDTGHPGAHESRNSDGAGLIGWWNAAYADSEEGTE